MEAENKKSYEEIRYHPKSGFAMLAVVIIAYIAAIGVFIAGAVIANNNPAGIALIFTGIVVLLAAMFITGGFKVINPNEAIVLVLFGKYKGTLLDEGFFWVNPFCRAYNPGAGSALDRIIMDDDKKPAAKKNASQVVMRSKLSLKAMTLNNEKQKVNDELGNPIEIGVIVIWKIVNTAKAVFNVENYAVFISTQADSAIRNVARRYPYDVSDSGDETSLRGSSQEIAEQLRSELQERVEVAGIQIIEARISHLAYAPEIAAAMLQRQQARAIIDARKMIVEGAVSMVEMALDKINENGICKLDDDKKASMVSNLLVVLCGSKDAQPVVPTGI